jgi:hypothetical protein
MEQKCETCIFWQDFEQRVWARISNTRGDKTRGLIELRLCTWKAHPSISLVEHEVYTDKEFSCNEYRRKDP